MERSSTTFRSLELIRKSGSTSRILNLHQVHERFGTTEAYNQKPLFRSKRLNASMIMKHSLRGSERYLFQAHGPTATKVILPLANGDLAIGGTNIFVGQKNFEGAVRDLAGGYNDDAALQQDIDLLEALDRIPSLDPFLLRERLRVMQREPARCYFQISDADLKSMQDFVSDQVNGLIQMAFAGEANSAAGREVCAQMASKILSDENAEGLAPLKAALGLDGAEWTDGVFCWKGFLYYKWMLQSLRATCANVLKEMQELNFMNCDSHAVSAVKRMRERAVALVQDRAKNVFSLLKVYDGAYSNMTVEKKPAAFKEFLLKSPKMFIEIGDSAGVVTHIANFWSFKFANTRGAALAGPELMELFQEFENCRTADGGAQSTEVVWR